jgi:hypothetical protein
MALIQVWKGNQNPSTDPAIGKGNGNVDSRAKTATITDWIDRGAVRVGEPYTLKSGGKLYDATAVAPVANEAAKFNDLR